MRNIVRSFSCALIAGLLSLTACKPNQYQGFYVGTYERLANPNPGGPPGPPQPLVGTTVTGVLSRNPPLGQCPWLGPLGSETSYFGSTGRSVNDPDELGVYYVSNAVAPACWNHEVWLPRKCNAPAPPVYLVSSDDFANEFERDNFWTVNTGAGTSTEISVAAEWDCLIPPGAIPAARPSFAITGSIPSTVTLPGMNPYTTEYGMPEMYVFNGENGSPAFYSLITADSVGPDGSSAIFPLPSSLPQNAYSFETVNQNSDGSVTANSFNYFAAASSQTIAGNPFGVAAQAVTTAWQSADNPDPYGDQTCAGQWVYNSGTNTNPFPVVTQYSLNQVNNGGVTISVGSNPTAIALYDSQDNRVDQNNGPCHSYESVTTQMTRAIVANSGSNTVSILNIVNNTVLETITVGSHPVA